jgi:hypothetical protein
MSDEQNYKAGRKPQDKESKEQKKGDNYLFVIGIDQYVNFPKLYNAVKDAKDFMALMLDRYQFKESKVFKLFDKEATADNIFSTLKQLRELIKPEDSLLVYFSGHGEYDQHLDEGYWIPYNGENGKNWTFIDFSKVKKYIRAIKSLHTFVIADSCYSGRSLQNRDKGKNSVPKDFFVPSRYVLTAGRNEVVLDGQQGKNSPFADSLMFHLRNDQGPHISASELCEKVKKEVSLNEDQIPRYGDIRGVGGRGGMFYFFEKGYAPERPRKEPPVVTADPVRDTRPPEEPVIETPSPQ